MIFYLMTAQADNLGDWTGRLPYPMKKIEAGSFIMGSPETLSCRHEDELQHRVVISSDYFIGIFEVSQENWKAVVGEEPSFFQGCPSCPVERVSWCDAVYFSNAMSKMDGLKPYYVVPKDFDLSLSQRECNSLSKFVKIEPQSDGYRLPTEAEWQYAAEAGGGYLYAGADGPDDVGWYKLNSGGRTHNIGAKKPNKYNLYDMSGNVWEWCWDWHAQYPGELIIDPMGPADGGSKVFRGGSWDFGRGGGRLNNRNQGMPGERSGYIGLRLVRTVPQ